MFPVSYIIQPELTYVGEFEWEGGFADVSRGEYGGRPVAVKQLKARAKDGFDKVFKVSDRTWPGDYGRLFSIQRLCREVLIWKRLSHPNILPLLGVSMSNSPQYFRIISEWMPNGHVTEYIRSNPEVNRLRLVSLAMVSSRGFMLIALDGLQLSEVASGVTYIHELGIAHGDLKGVRLHVPRSPLRL